MSESEAKLTEENKDDIFTCDMCGKGKTRQELRKLWTSIPFAKEFAKKYYCGCMGWD